MADERIGAMPADARDFSLRKKKQYDDNKENKKQYDTRIGGLRFTILINLKIAWEQNFYRIEIRIGS